MDGPLKSFVLTVTFTSIQVESEYELKLPTSLLARCTVKSYCHCALVSLPFPFSRFELAWLSLTVSE